MDRRVEIAGVSIVGASTIPADDDDGPNRAAPVHAARAGVADDADKKRRTFNPCGA